ncbi:MAG: FkbM family methyltransferase [Rhodanobacteraceae bacterium]|nr:MAG: FkbM family methyltransferase [Rhodanobacteraceae bacterium]
MTKCDFVHFEPRSVFWMRGVLHHLIVALKRGGRNDPPYRLCAFPNDVIGRDIALTGTYEGAGIAAIEWLCDEGVIENPAASAFLDIGANIGVYTVSVGARFARVLAFEPHPVIGRVLALNVEINNVSNVDQLHYGLSDKDATAQLWEGDADNFGASSIERGVGGGRHYAIPLRSASTAVREATDLPVALVKMDVEGHEPKVIAGLAGLLAEQHPVVAFEANDPVHNEGLLTQLRRLGYSDFMALDYSPAVPWFWLHVAMRTLFGARTRLRPVSSLEGKRYSMVFAFSHHLGKRFPAFA